MNKSQLLEELRTIQTELIQLGRMIVSGNTIAKNHQIALFQHVRRIMKELESEKPTSEDA